MNEKVEKIEKLSDLIEWDTDALNLLESLMARMRAEIAKEAIMVSFRNNRPKISKGTIINVLHSIKPVTYFVDPED